MKFLLAAVLVTLFVSVYAASSGPPLSGGTNLGIFDIYCELNHVTGIGKCEFELLGTLNLPLGLVYGAEALLVDPNTGEVFGDAGSSLGLSLGPVQKTITITYVDILPTSFVGKFIVKITNPLLGLVLYQTESLYTFP